MTILIFGGNGQVGRELSRAFHASSARVVATSRSGQLENGAPCERADFNQPEQLTALLDKVKPTQVINAAAYTAVDTAETEPEAAFRANAEAPGVIAGWCARHAVPMVHYSTDYVFDGQGSEPYPPDAITAPLGVYGASKLAGEEAVRAAGGRHLILRTAWVYAAHGHNFLRTMVRVGAQRDTLSVVADQIGTPTPAALIADVTMQLLADPGRQSGTWHLTAVGQTSWHGFAEEIFARALEQGLIEQAPQVLPITTAEYPTPAQRPVYSCLDTSSLQRDFGVQLPAWQRGVDQVLRELVAAS